MGAYEDVRRDVSSQYDELLRRAETSGTNEGLGSAAVPSITVSGSQPAWLGAGWRQGLAASAMVGALLGLGLMAWSMQDGGDSASTVAGLSGAFAIVTVVVAYFTVAGFGKAEFSIGTGGGDDSGGGGKSAPGSGS